MRALALVSVLSLSVSVCIGLINILEGKGFLHASLAIFFAPAWIYYLVFLICFVAELVLLLLRCAERVDGDDEGRQRQWLRR